ncbi:MAG: 1-phosphofructokinase [Oscillospiraceae bacterium]|jgi:1-phosphofructokinase|nr:1-phosphofructokinase [Oscillospiraceae bacterium]
MIYTVTCNPALDYVMRVPSFLPGETNRAETAELQAGGKGINVSYILTQLGRESVALGFLAGDTGELLLRRIREMGVRSDFLFLPAGQTRINVKVKSRLETELNGRGPEIPSASLTALLEKLDRLDEGDTLVLSGSVPPSLPPSVYGDILNRLAGKGVRSVVDAAGDLLALSLPFRPFLVKPNHRELGDLLGRFLAPDDIPALTLGARELQRRGAENVLVSLGEHGALLAAADGEIYLQKAPAGSPQNSVGAGDSAVAGFLAACDQGYAQGLRLAVAAGSATAFSPGLARREEILSVSRQME